MREMMEDDILKLDSVDSWNSDCVGDRVNKYYTVHAAAGQPAAVF